jgi:AraC-like DNA-binding protein
MSYICDERVLEMMKFIDSNIENGNWKRKQIADHVAVSPDRLSHIMKCETGMTIRDYILLCKINKGDVHLYNKKELMVLYKNANMTLKLFEQRHGMRLHAVYRKL